MVVAISLAACTSGAARLALSDAAHTADTESDDASTSACANPQDCIGLSTDLAVFCCVHNACIVGQAALAQTCSDPTGQKIMASSYDQSCQEDSDCIAVEEGNFCDPGVSNGCTNATINKRALPQYNSDLAKTQAAVCLAVSSCVIGIGSCCQHGTCQVNGPCFSAVQGDAATDSGGDAGTSDAPASG